MRQNYLIILLVYKKLILIEFNVHWRQKYRTIGAAIILRIIVIIFRHLNWFIFKNDGRIEYNCLSFMFCCYKHTDLYLTIFLKIFPSQNQFFYPRVDCFQSDHVGTYITARQSLHTRRSRFQQRTYSKIHLPFECRLELCKYQVLTGKN